MIFKKLNRRLYLSSPKAYSALANIRMTLFVFTGQIKKAERIITEHFNFVPQEGSTIKITNLPFNNAYPTANCYIGSIGIAKEVGQDGSFTLEMKSGSILIVHNRYEFEYIKAEKYFNQ